MPQLPDRLRANPWIRHPVRVVYYTLEFLYLLVATPLLLIVVALLEAVFFCRRFDGHYWEEHQRYINRSKGWND